MFWTRRRLFFVALLAMSPTALLVGISLLFTPSRYVIDTLLPVPGVKVILYGRRRDFTERWELWYEVVVNGTRLSEPDYVGPLPDHVTLHFRAIAVEGGNLIGVYEASQPHLLNIIFDARTGRHWPGRQFNNISADTTLLILEGLVRRFKAATGDPKYEVGRVLEIDID